MRNRELSLFTLPLPVELHRRYADAAAHRGAARTNHEYRSQLPVIRAAPHTHDCLGDNHLRKQSDPEAA